MLLLGIHAVGHDTSAALVEGGRVLFAVEEERLSRKKHDGSFPRRAIRAALGHVGASAGDLDAVCLSYDPLETVEQLHLRHILKYWPRTVPMLLQDAEYVRRTLNLENEVREVLDYHKEVYCCPHHVAHMASAYYLSGFADSALFSVDGLGEIASSVIGEARGTELRVFDEYTIDFPTSIGLIYSAVTDFLGFKHHCDEGKVMGLAPYGRREPYAEVFDKLLAFEDNGRYTLNLAYFEYPFTRARWLTDEFIEACGAPREPGGEITQRHMDIAAALQALTEKAMLHTAAQLRRLSDSPNLSLAGGVALNCVGNGRLLREAGFKRIYVQPAAYDAGTAIGAALHYHYAHRPDTVPAATNHTYFGEGFSDVDVTKRLRRRGIAYREEKDAPRTVAAALADGRIVAWFNGRMEFGPRALGNRSILAPPFPAEMKDILNHRVKHREWFRPFAPAVRREDLSEYFETTHESPFMLLTQQVRPEYRGRLDAITHVDGSARVQTVDGGQNKPFYDLIGAFKDITGIGVLLNTSFNVMGQPIVNTPDEAVDCFLSTDIDLLVFNGRYIIDAAECTHLWQAERRKRADG
jgi:carbamoyltransferase